MAKKFPLDIVIGATDKASAALRRVTDRIDKFNEPFARLRKSFGQFADKTGLTGVGLALKNVGSVAWDTAKRITVGFTLAAGAAGALIYKNIMLADSIGDTAERLNIGTDKLQAWQYGFNQADVSTEDFNSALDTLNKNFGLAKIGMGKALPLFRGLGIDPKRFKTIDQLLPVLADRLSKIRNPATRAAIATRLLGDAGAQMAVTLGKGAHALEDMNAAAREAGVIIDPETIKNAGELDKLFKRLRATFSGVAGNALGALYPALIKIAVALQDMLIKYQPRIKEFAETFAKNLPGYIEKLAYAFRGLRATLAPFAEVLGEIVERFGAGNTVMAAIAVLVGGKLIFALASLGAALVNLGVSSAVAFGIPGLIVAGVAAAVAAGWYLYKNWDKISDAIDGTIAQIVENFSNAWASVKSAAVSAFEWIVGKLSWLWEHSPLYLAFKGLQFVSDKLMPEGRTGTPRGAPMGANLLQQSPAQRVQVSVDLSNLPAGTRASAKASDGVMFDLSRGWAMPGVP